MAMHAAGSQRRNGGRRRRTSLMNEINVTPMVDVMLVLLIIFMVTAPLLTAGVEVDLPKTEAAPLPGTDEPLVVSVDAAGQVYLQETVVDLQSLPAQMQAVAGANPDLRVFVRGDRAIDYGRVMAVVGTLQAAGYRRVALITEPLPEPLREPLRPGGRPRGS